MKANLKKRVPAPSGLGAAGDNHSRRVWRGRVLKRLIANPGGRPKPFRSVAGALDRPFVVIPLQQQRPDQAGDGGFVGKILRPQRINVY